MLDQHAEAGKSKVVVARDAALHGPGGQLDEKRVLALLDRAIAAYTGHDKPVEAWKRIVPVGKVIGLKVNGLGGKGSRLTLALVLAVCERLQQAGVKPGNIVVWDRNARDLQACGLTINTDPSRIRCYGNDVAGYEEQPVVRGGKREAGQDSHPRVRHGDQSAHSQGSRAGGRHLCHEEYVRRGPAAAELHANGCNPGVPI
jgi:hypothetical protein